MIIDVDAVQYLNVSTVTEAVPSEYSILLGTIFLFVGFVFILRVWLNAKREKRKLKTF